MDKNIKEIAEELNTNKMKIFRIIEKHNIKTKRYKNKVIIDNKEFEKIKKIICYDNRNKKNNGYETSYENKEADDLKNIQENNYREDMILFLKKELDTAHKQNESLQKLLDQQQVLTLQANKKIEQLELQQEEKVSDVSEEIQTLKKELSETKEDVKKSFWQRLFGN